ncbi:hypothetical protein LP420_24160 [Massilia sp. B-10]|nr:hypothetical protein LP420_24160 [Massilia sp. B-10]
MFYCVQEALTNALRHADAAQLDIALRKRDGQVLLTIDDDGCGAHGAAEGNGMRGMRERVASAGGTIAAGPGPAPRPPARHCPAADRGRGMIRVLLVDDQTLVRSGIRGLLEMTEDIRVVAEAADGNQAQAVLA